MKINTPNFTTGAKNPNLHSWMQELYLAKGCENEDFDLATTLLSDTDIDKLESDFKAADLPETSVFFFGETTGEVLEEDIEFISNARVSLANGRKVAY